MSQLYPIWVNVSGKGANDWPLVSPFIDSMTFADGSFETRSRSEEKAMQGHRVVVASRTRRRRARHKHHRIYEGRHLVKDENLGINGGIMFNPWKSHVPLTHKVSKSGFHGQPYHPLSREVQVV